MKNKKWILLLIALGLISVKFYFFYLCDLNNNFSNKAISANYDASHYLAIGKNIADYQVYSDTHSNIASEMATWRPPFWPFVLSLFFKISDNFFILMLLKSILEVVLIVLFLFQFKKGANLKLIYLLPFFIVFIEPQYLKYSMSFLSESLSSILILGLSILFVTRSATKGLHIAIPILASIVILCHPVSVFFVISLFIIYLVFNFRSNFAGVLLHGLIFSIFVLAWPYRNYITFDKGIYLTASQGATFAKGWNEKVSTEFTNVEGDLGDEGLNLKYVEPKLVAQAKNSVLDLSHLYTVATKNFIKDIGFEEIARIALKKLKSNFNPFPERPKPGFLETASIFFRILNLVVFVQMIIRFFRKDKIDFNSLKDKVCLVVLAIFIGQIIMSVYVYTGIRFNTIYSLALLFCFLCLNMGFWVNLIKSMTSTKEPKTN